MTLQNIENGTEMEQKNICSTSKNRSKLGKSHQDYWTSKLRKRSYVSKGKTSFIPDWQVRIAHLGRREWFNLGTPNKASATIKARDIYVSLLAIGWEPTLTKFKPE